MAGGADWSLVGKSDKYDTWNVENGSQYTYWRSLVTDFEIEKKVAAASVDTGPGDLGQVSGVLSFRVGLTASRSRSLSGTSKFLCIADDTDRIEEFADQFMRTQVWRYVGAAQQYDPSTGAAV